jgi:arginine-tRNA-protein transferase
MATALKEIEWVQETMKKVPELKYYYMGFYIHTCAKMRYKGNYVPSDLLDPESYVWVPLADCIPKLNRSKYTTFVEVNTQFG